MILDDCHRHNIYHPCDTKERLLLDSICVKSRESKTHVGTQTSGYPLGALKEEQESLWGLEMLYIEVWEMASGLVSFILK